MQEKRKKDIVKDFLYEIKVLDLGCPILKLKNKSLKK